MDEIESIVGVFGTFQDAIEDYKGVGRLLVDPLDAVFDFRECVTTGFDEGVLPYEFECAEVWWWVVEDCRVDDAD